MTTQWVDGLPVRLRVPHPLDFLSRWGRVVRVLDEQDSGNLCLVLAAADERVFVKYAGASTLRFDGEPAEAVARLRAAGAVSRALAHPTLARLREAVDVGHGHALVFDWVDAVPLGRQYGQAGQVRALSPAAAADAVQQLLDLHVEVVARGWVAVDLYDGSLLLDPETGRVTVVDVDLYRRAPTRNDLGRMWGSTRFMAPEEHVRGAVLDEVTTVFTLGALAHTFLGDDETKDPRRWRGSAAHLAAAARALQPDRAERWPSVAALAAAWRAAPGPV